jgi:hypothetical protein
VYYGLDDMMDKKIKTAKKNPGYHRPNLIIYGNIVSLTAAGSGQSAEGNGANVDERSKKP